MCEGAKESPACVPPASAGSGLVRFDYTGTYILPGLVDGFAGLNSQAQANA